MTIEELLNAFHHALDDGESLQWRIERNGDTLSLAFVPMLSNDAKVPAGAEPVRAALALPLVIREKTLEKTAEALQQQLSGYAQARRQATSAYDELLVALSDATAKAKNEASKAGTKKPPTEKSKKQKLAVEKPKTTNEVDGCEAGCGVLDF